MKNKEQMLVASIRNGTVIDHIPAAKLFKVAALLRLESVGTPITIGNNLPSRGHGSKGVIKLTDRFFCQEELNRIAILAPNVHLNVIREYEVVEKRQISLPKEICGLVRCTNVKCVTNAEPVPTHFFVEDSEEETLVCKYCSRKLRANQIELL